MADQSSLAAGVHFVGSLPLSTSEEVLTTLCAAVPGRLVSIPDGETGERDTYIAWERLRFPLETLHEAIGGKPLPEGHSGVFTQEDVKPAGYDTAAKESYQKFRELRGKGVIPPGVRFQVSVPAPYECIQGHLRPQFQAQLEPFYEKRIFDALQNILAAIPAEDLVIQFDMCFVVTALEYEQGRLSGDFFKPHFSPIRPGLIERAQRLCEQVPTNIPIGWHLCYGDLGHKHFVEPEDMGLMVDFSNDLAQAIQPRQPSWLHMPVPKGRDDQAYFEPLKRLNTGADTKLYLGLIHANDETGTQRRIQAAQHVVKDFGAATECGMGRTPREELDSILQISKNVTKPVNASL